jgi:hypothetical protein
MVLNLLMVKEGTSVPFLVQGPQEGDLRIRAYARGFLRNHFFICGKIYILAK